MYCDNARCVKSTVADGVGRPVLVNRIFESAFCVKKEVVEDDWPTNAVRLRLNIDSGSVQSFWAAGTGAACKNDESLSTYRVHPTAGGTEFLNGAPSCACYMASKATPPGLVHAQGSTGCTETMRAV